MAEYFSICTFSQYFFLFCVTYGEHLLMPLVLSQIWHHHFQCRLYEISGFKANRGSYKIHHKTLNNSYAVDGNRNLTALEKGSQCSEII